MARKKPAITPMPPVTDDHRDALQAVLASCQQTEQLCEQCRQCNIDVLPEATMNAEQAEMAQKLLNTFWPHAT